MTEALYRASIEGQLPNRNVEIRATSSTHNGAFARLAREAAVRSPGSSIISLGVRGMDDSGEWLRLDWRVWWSPPSHWRDEHRWPGRDAIVEVVRDEARMIYLPFERTLYTNERLAPDGPWELISPPPGIFELPSLSNRSNVFPLFRPRLPQASWQFSTLDENESFLGRRVRRVRATRRTGHDDASGLWPWVDELECLVDDDLELVLRVVGISAGESIAEFAIDELRLDEPMGEDLFAFVPPPRTRVVVVERFE
jgi:hypothetical protein